MAGRGTLYLVTDVMAEHRLAPARLVRIGFADPDAAAALMARPPLSLWDPVEGGAVDDAAAAIVSALEIGRAHV